MHLDIKPDNIMVDKDGEPKLMDLGISQKVKEFEEGMIAGTPHYMAPEQVEGKAEKRSDIYALGATLYEVVIGHPPFYREKVDSLMNLFFKKTRENPAKLKKLNPDVSTDIEAICAKCMEKNLKNRYKNADRFTDDLNNFLDKKPISANELNFARECQRLFRRHKKACVVGATFVTIFITMVFAWGWHINQKNIELNQKNTELEKKTALNNSDRGFLYQKEKDPASALFYFERARKVIEKYKMSYAKVHNNKGWLFLEDRNKNQGKFLEEIQKKQEKYRNYQPEQDFREAIAIDPYYPTAYLNMGIAYEKNNNFEQAQDYYSKAIECKWEESKTYQEDVEDQDNLPERKKQIEKEIKVVISLAHFNRGKLYQQQNQIEKAIADYSEAIKYNPKDHEAYFNRGKLYQQQGQIEKAIADYSEAIKHNPKDHEAHFNRGKLYQQQGQIEKAIADYNEAIKHNPQYDKAYFNRGKLYQQQGQIEKAIADYNKYLSLDKKNPDLYFNRALIYRQQQLYKEAIEDCERIIQINPNYPNIHKLKSTLIKEMNNKK